MSAPRTSTIDGNEAAASVAYRLNDLAAIYPITPSSPMGELCDEWAARSQPNLWGNVPRIVEMQSEAGAAGAVHGGLQAGSLATTFTASQGLLLMIPNLYKIAGELTACCLHVAARTVATHALSIFGDHSDVMACRQIGLGLMASGSVQEAHDLACIAQAASLRSRVPFIHFFDGFRTSHEVSKISMLSDDDLRHMIDDDDVRAHRERALTPDRPVIRGTAQNPDAYFQAREACNPFYAACAGTVQETMDRFAERTGRRYRLFDYFGHPQAERVVVLMGSGAETACQTVEHLARDEKVGVVVVRLYRPFDAAALFAALPTSTRRIAVLDRTKEPGAPGEPLYMDVVTAVREAEEDGTLPLAQSPRVIGGRYGLSSKEFTPAMVKAVLDELSSDTPRREFTVGINDDVTGLSLTVTEELDVEPEGVVRAVFYGLGADGTVGANKNSIKIIGEGTDHFVQGYFVYDSKKSGAMTVSHLRFGPEPLRSPYLITKASFVACHQFSFLEKIDVLEHAADGATFLLNSPHSVEETWQHLPAELRASIRDKKLKVYIIDAATVARDAGMGGRINTVMQSCFFALAGVLPREEAIARIKAAIEKTYERKGAEVVRRNWDAVDASLDHMKEMPIPPVGSGDGRPRPPMVSSEAPDFVTRITAQLMEGKGDLLPVSAFPVDGTWPTGTTQWEKRNIADAIPIWDKEVCIQCNKCAMVCPHAAIRAKIYDPSDLEGAPESFESTEWRGKEFPGKQYTIQVAPEDCTGCDLCVHVCPAKNKAEPRRKAINMEPQPPALERERENFQFFLDLPELDRTEIERLDVKSSQFLQPLFEYSGACAGCGETPYVKLLTQLYGDRLLISNATGCSSIYGGNLPSTPYRKNSDGRGPAWSNSLFEDNAEFGLGFRLAIDGHRDHAALLVSTLAGEIGDTLTQGLLLEQERTEKGIRAQRERVAALRDRLAGVQTQPARMLDLLADYLVPKSVWLVGGDGWAYDIGFGGLDHVMSLQHNVNILVLDTEVYSNTGGQASKATPLGAAAKFAVRGKETDKKDLGLMAMSYGHVYVASIAFGAKDAQTIKAFEEADSYPGPSLIIAYSHCIAHGYDMAFGADQQARAVKSGIWPLFRYDPRRAESGEAPLIVDAPGGKIPVQEYMRNEARFRMVEKIDPERFRRFASGAQQSAARRMAVYDHMARLRFPQESGTAEQKAGGRE